MRIIGGKIAKAQKVVIYGPEGIGKSTLASHFPEVVFLDVEGSTANMDVRRSEDKPTSWIMLMNQIAFIKANPHVCKTLVIDTIDKTESLAKANIIAEHNKQGIEDFGYGKGYVYLEEEMGRLLNRLQDLVDSGINVVLIAHSQIKKFERPDENGSYDRFELKLEKKNSPLVKEWGDMVLFCDYKTYIVVDDKTKKGKGQGGERVMYTEHRPAWDAKNRHGLPPEIPMDYKYIAHIFENQVASNTQTSVQQVPVTPETTVQTPQPVATVTPQEQATVKQPNIDDIDVMTPIPESVPKALRDLMIQSNVSVKRLEQVVHSKGYYPVDTPLERFDPKFIEGALIAQWNLVLAAVAEDKQLPF